MKAIIGTLAGLGLLCALAIVLWVGGRLTGLLQFYSVPTPGNLPTMPIGARYLATRLITPKRLDFISFQSACMECGGSSGPWTQRLCGLPGDTVEIRQGRLLVNGQDLDAQLDVARHYALPTPAYHRLRQAGEVADTLMADVQPDSTFRVGLSESQARRHPEARLTLLPARQPDERILKQYQQPWNQDNFGPYRVPADHYFLLGDNRLNSLDSRYLGCVPTENFLATIFWR